MERNSTALKGDRYHYLMAEFGLNIDPAKIGILFGELKGTWYLTQRGLPYAPCLGHSQLIDLLNRSRADESRARFLEQDRAGSGLKTVAERLRHSRFPGTVELVPEGTIVFDKEPFGIVRGPFAMTQNFEVAFKHSFNFQMTVAYWAMKMRQAVGKDVYISDFSLRSAGKQALEATESLYIGGFDDTSNMEAAFLDGIVSVGTMAHYLTQAFVAYVECVIETHRRNPVSMNPMSMSIPKSWYENGKFKHPERIFIDYWLDFHPKGTAVTTDTFSVKQGMIHFIESALSSPERKKAGRMVRIDSGNLAKGTIFAREILDANGLYNVGILLSGDLSPREIKKISDELRIYCLKNRKIEDPANFNPLKEMGITGVAGGKKFVAEIEKEAGVIFKLINFWGEPSLKCSDTPGKETLPGNPSLQVWRCENEQEKYIMDIIGLSDEREYDLGLLFGYVKAKPLIRGFWQQGGTQELMTVHELKDFVARQKEKFIVPLDQYRNERIHLSPALSALSKSIRKKRLTEYSTKIKTVGWPKE